MLINADIGEMTGHDAQIMPHIHIGNIACGYHASNPQHMAETVALADKYQVKISAHPGYKDPENFGRISIPHTQSELTELVDQQVSTLQEICIEHNTQLFAIKPHGALYHDMLHQPHVLSAIIAIAKKFKLPLIVPATAEASSWNVPVFNEVFADRSYLPSGALTPRSQSNALLSSPAEIIVQAQQLMRHDPITTSSKTSLLLKADTICFHGDHEASVKALEQLHARG